MTTFDANAVIREYVGDGVAVSLRTLLNTITAYPVMFMMEDVVGGEDIRNKAHEAHACVEAVHCLLFGQQVVDGAAVLITDIYHLTYGDRPWY